MEYREVTYLQLTRWIVAVIVVVVFPPLLMLTVIGWADSSVNRRPGAALEFAAVLVPIWGLWFAAIALVIRTRGRPKKARPHRRDREKPA